MRITESKLRGLIRQILREDAGGPAALKQSSTAVIQAINDDDAAAFWGALMTNFEGMAGTVHHAPAGDKMEQQKFIELLRPAAKLCNQLRNAYQQDAKEKKQQLNNPNTQAKKQ